MKSPIFVRSLTESEKQQLKKALHSSDAFVLRRAQIILASDRQERASQIAHSLGCGSQTVRDVIHDFDERGLDALVEGSSRPLEVHAAFDEGGAESLKELLHHSPRDFGIEESFWTLEHVAEISFQEGIIERRVTGETIRATLARLGLRWARVKHWIESPDPQYARKKGHAIG